MTKEQYRPELRNLLKTIFIIECEHSDELTAIAEGEGTQQERAERYLDFIIDKFNFADNV